MMFTKTKTVALMLLFTAGAVSISVAADAANTGSIPAPRHLTGPVHPQQPNQPYKLPKNMDGCDRNYGVQHQCIPVDLPTGAAGCAYLAKHHFKDLKVVLQDNKKLDTDGDKIVCN